MPSAAAHPFAAGAQAPVSLCLLALLCLLLPLSAAGQALAPPVEGRDYVRIEDGQRWRPEPGTIEVVEVFAYSCSHCDHFRPMLEDWKRAVADDVRVYYVPAAFSPHDAYARGFFALEALDRVAQVHPRLFDAIHRERSLPARGATAEKMATFLAGEGLDPARVSAAMASPATDEKMNMAYAFAVRSGLQGTPTLIINGRYRVLGRTLQDSLRIADGLIRIERAAAR